MLECFPFVRRRGNLRHAAAASMPVNRRGKIGGGSGDASAKQVISCPWERVMLRTAMCPARVAVGAGRSVGRSTRMFPGCVGSCAGSIGRRCHCYDTDTRTAIHHHHHHHHHHRWQVYRLHQRFATWNNLTHHKVKNKSQWKKRSEETQTLRAGCSKAEPKLSPRRRRRRRPASLGRGTAKI